MLLKISSDPEFTAYNETSFFQFYSEQPSITVSRSDDLSIFQIAVFLQSLQTLCRRHLRSRFFRESENLTGKIKGRVKKSDQKRKLLIGGRKIFDFKFYNKITKRNSLYC